MPVVKEQSKDGTDKNLDTESRGTLTDKKNMSPRNVLFQSKNFKETNIKFGSTANNEQFKGDKLAQHDTQFNKTHVNAKQTSIAKKQSAMNVTPPNKKVSKKEQAQKQQQQQPDYTKKEASILKS